MKRETPQRFGKLALTRETLLHLTEDELQKAAAAGTLTYEGSCDNSFCPCPTQTGEIG